MNIEEAVIKVKKTFAEAFGGEADAVYFAPGRVNLIGEHVDYNGGHVFPCALTLGTYGAFRKRADKKIRLISANFPENGVEELPAGVFAPLSSDSWTAYVLGVVWAYAGDGYICDTGFDLAIYGTLPGKSGLSSSASLEVLVGTALMDQYGFACGQVRNALLGQKAENKYVGVNCGIMDQFSSAMGKKDHAIILDCASLSYQHVPLDLGDASLVIVNTNKPHVLADSAYNERRAQCETAFAELKAVKPGLPSLCALTPEEFLEIGSAIKDPDRYRRARHAVMEEARTRCAVAALLGGQLTEFGRLMNASHVSLRDDFEVSCPELDLLASLAWDTEGVIGGRMTGGGFGGCTVNIVRNEAVEGFVKNAGAAYRKEIGYDASFYVLGAGEGARRVG